MVRFDFACKRCEKTFVVWSDSAKICPHCGSKRVFKVFLTPPAINTGDPARIEKLAEEQLEAAGLSNYTNRNGDVKRTRKTDPKMLEAIAAAKRENVPFNPGGIVTGPNGINPLTQKQTIAVPTNSGQFVAPGSGGIARATTTPSGTGAQVNSLMRTGRRVDPLMNRTIVRQSKDPKADSDRLNALLKR